MPAQATGEQVQGVWWHGHLLTQATEEAAQGVRRCGPLPAQVTEEQVQGVWQHGHLPAWAGKEVSTNGEQVRDYHHKFEGGKTVSVVVMPPQAH